MEQYKFSDDESVSKYNHTKKNNLEHPNKAKQTHILSPKNFFLRCTLKRNYCTQASGVRYKNI